MDDKVFVLLEKLYIEMQDMKANMATREELQEIKGSMATKEELQEIKGSMATRQELQEVKGSMATKHDIVRLENKMDSNFKALYDGYKQSIEGITEVKIKLDKLTDRVENQEIKLQVLKSVK